MNNDETSQNKASVFNQSAIRSTRRMAPKRRINKDKLRAALSDLLARKNITVHQIDDGHYKILSKQFNATQEKIKKSIAEILKK